MVKTPRLQAKQDPLPSPLMGEGRDGGEKLVDATPTFVLPRPGGGWFSLVGLKPTPYEANGLMPVVVY